MATPFRDWFSIDPLWIAVLAFVATVAPHAGAAELKQLTKDGKLKSDVVFIDDGERLVFTQQETPTLLCLMVLKLSDGSIARLHPQAVTNEFEAAFTPDMQWCAFVQSRGNLVLRLVLRDLKSGKDHFFEPGGGFVGMRKPAFSPDGSRVVFSFATPTGQQLVSINNHGKDRKDLTQTGINNFPAFSPDGKRLAFASSRDGDFELYSMNADGSDTKRLTNSPGMDIRPAFSPNGKRIAFVSNRDGNYEIYLADADGSNPRRLTNHPERDDYPAWHPDGKRLAFVREFDGRHDLVLLDLPD
jgi:TolB protein